MTKELTFSQKCSKYLSERWEQVGSIVENELEEPLSGKLSDFKKVIFDCLTSKTKTYRYVLPTQILSKCVDSTLDCRSIQVSWSKKGAFDARSVAHDVIVPFDRSNHNVLGGSPEPYVNNPLRCPAVIPEYRGKQKNQTDWDKLIIVLDAVQSEDNVEFTKNVFDQVLYEIYKLLSSVIVTYPTPNRISLDNAIVLITEYISVKSGGERLEAVSTALFKIISEKFGLFDEVKREKINTADASSGMVADIECKLRGKTVLLIEVKDRNLTLTQLDSKLDKARSERISEILFLAENGIDKSKEKEIAEKIRHEFTSGQNIYISNLLDFCKGILMLLGEKGRVEFLSKIGPELDRVNASIKHRKAWAKLLKEI